MNQSTEVALQPTDPVSVLEEGQVVSFDGAPDDWDRLDVSIVGSSRTVGKPVERDRITIGDWYWDDGPSLFSSFIPELRCKIDG